MTRERAVLVMAGTMVLLSQALAVWVNPWWDLLAVFVGLNLVQSAFTGFCPAAIIFARLGLPEGSCSVWKAGSGKASASPVASGHPNP